MHRYTIKNLSDENSHICIYQILYIYIVCICIYQLPQTILEFLHVSHV